MQLVACRVGTPDAWAPRLAAFQSASGRWSLVAEGGGASGYHVFLRLHEAAWDLDGTLRDWRFGDAAQALRWLDGLRAALAALDEAVEPVTLLRRLPKG